MTTQSKNPVINAINNVPSPTEKMARRVLQKQPDGTTKIVMVDANTGVPLSNTNGYTIEDQGSYIQNLDNLGLNPKKDNTPPKPTTAQKVINPNSFGGNGMRGADGGVGGDTAAGRAMARNASNNFGYYSKPDVMSYASYAPGMIGLAAKAANLGVNLNNMNAVQDARAMMGLAPNQSFMDNAGAALNGNQGQVANVNIGDNSYHVGFEALSPTGQTNLTPAEAVTRAALANQKISLTPPDQLAANNQAFNNQDYSPAHTTMLGRFKNSVASFFDNMFSPSNPTYASPDSFPSAPSSTSTVDNMSTSYGGSWADANAGTRPGTYGGGGSSWSDGGSHTAAPGSGSYGSGGFASNDSGGGFGSSGSPNGRGPGTGGGGGGYSAGGDTY
jgi:hypothetical protein